MALDTERFLHTGRNDRWQEWLKVKPARSENERPALIRARVQVATGQASNYPAGVAPASGVPAGAIPASSARSASPRLSAVIRAGVR